jgi:D-glycero-beta-D-manno-heptose 1-phosphate adenylyltransferase
MKSEKIRKKILSRSELLLQISEWKLNKEVIVFTNGCFDLIHPGHVTYLAQAADQGTKLIVALNTDLSVKKLKGNHRPIIDETGRALVMASFSFVDAVVLFDDETPENLISEIVPHVLVKGKDYKIEEIAGHKTVLDKGGKVITIELVPDYSTTSIENKIKNQ